MLYSLNGSYPTILPHTIRLSNGYTRTDPTSFTEEEIADAGWVSVDNPPTYDHPNVLEWSGTDWVVRAPNQVEIANRWIEIKTQCLQILIQSDYKVIKSYELNVPLDQNWVNYRQAIRDIYNDTNGIDPWNVVWPDPPAQE